VVVIFPNILIPGLLGLFFKLFEKWC